MSTSRPAGGRVATGVYAMHVRGSRGSRSQASSCAVALLAAWAIVLAGCEDDQQDTQNGAQTTDASSPARPQDGTRSTDAASPARPDGGTNAASHDNASVDEHDASARDDDGGADAPTYPRLEADDIGEPQVVATGFGLAESPLWDRCNDRVLLADVVGDDMAGVIDTVSLDGEVGVYASATSNANGMAFDVDGSLVVAQMGGSPGHLARLDDQGAFDVLEPEGSPTLHTPDDVIVRSDGTTYFTDGDFYPIGNLLGFSSVLPVYMLAPESDELVAVAAVSGPNGVELSPDEQTLYVSAYGANTVMSYSVAEDGSLSQEQAALTGLASPDSLCLDAAGNLYIAVHDGLQVARPDGELVALIPIPPPTTLQGTTNCTFGGDDGRTLFITSWTTLYSVDDMPIPGLDWLTGKTRQHCD